jgi:glycosyltransferase involved in cell wall biosynthesis
MMNQDQKNIMLSIIIPMYKVAPYVKKCLRSLADQDIPFSSYEIICVNDGSPDNCSEIVESLQNEIPNIVLINQENQGVSMARNNALAIAKGKYMMPIDPDDYVVPNCLKAAIDQAESKDLDVLYLGFEIFDENGISNWFTNYIEQEKIIQNGVEGYFASRGYDVRDPDRSVAILYRKSMLDQYDIKYPKDVPYLEDGLFLAKVFAVAEKVGFKDDKFYQRTTRIGSATNSRLFYSEKAINGFIKGVEDVKLFAIKNKLKPEKIELINHVVAKFILLPIISIISSKNIFRYYQLIKKLKNNNINKIELKGLRLVYFQLAKKYNYSPIIFFFYYPIYERFLKKF